MTAPSLDFMHGNEVILNKSGYWFPVVPDEPEVKFKTKWKL